MSFFSRNFAAALSQTIEVVGSYVAPLPEDEEEEEEQQHHCQQNYSNSNTENVIDEYGASDQYDREDSDDMDDRGNSSYIAPFPGPLAVNVDKIGSLYLVDQSPISHLSDVTLSSPVASVDMDSQLDEQEMENFIEEPLTEVHLTPIYSRSGSIDQYHSSGITVTNPAYVHIDNSGAAGNSQKFRQNSISSIFNGRERTISGEDSHTISQSDLYHTNDHSAVSAVMNPAASQAAAMESHYDIESPHFSHDEYHHSSNQSIHMTDGHDMYIHTPVHSIDLNDNFRPTHHLNPEDNVIQIRSRSIDIYKQDDFTNRQLLASRMGHDHSSSNSPSSAYSSTDLPPPAAAADTSAVTAPITAAATSTTMSPSLYVDGIELEKKIQSHYRTALETRVMDYESEHGKLLSIMDDIQRENSTLKQEIDHQHHSSELEGKYRQLSAAYEQLSSQHEELLREHSQSAKTLFDTNQINQNLISQLHQMQSEITNVSQLNDQLQQQLYQLQQASPHPSEEANQLRQENSYLSQLNDDLQRQLAAVESHRVDEVNQLQSEITRLEGVNDVLSHRAAEESELQAAEIRSLTALSEELQLRMNENDTHRLNEISRLHLDSQQLLESNNALQQQLSELSAHRQGDLLTAASLQQANNDLQSQLYDIQSQHMNDTAEINRLTQLIAPSSEGAPAVSPSAEEANQSANRLIEELRGQLSSAVSEHNMILQAKAADIHRLTEEANYLRTQLSESHSLQAANDSLLTALSDSLQSQLNDRSHELSQNQLLYAELSRELSELKASQSTRESESAALIQQLSEDNHHLHEQLSVYDSNLTQAVSEKESLLTAMKQSEQSLHRMQQAYQSSQEDSQRLLATCNDLTGQLAALQREKDHHRHQLQQLESQLIRLSEENAKLHRQLGEIDSKQSDESQQVYHAYQLLRQDFNDLRQEKNEIESKLSSSEELLRQLQQEGAAQLQQIKQLEVENKSLDNRNFIFQQENDRLQSLLKERESFPSVSPTGQPSPQSQHSEPHSEVDSSGSGSQLSQSDTRPSPVTAAGDSDMKAQSDCHQLLVNILHSCKSHSINLSLSTMADEKTALPVSQSLHHISDLAKLLIDKIQRQSMEVEALTAKSSSLQIQITMDSAKIVSTQKEVKEVSEVNQSLRAKIAKLENEGRQFQTIIAQLRQSRKVNNQDVDSIVSERDDYRNQLSQLQEAYEAMEASYQQLQSQQQQYDDMLVVYHQIQSQLEAEQQKIHQLNELLYEKQRRVDIIESDMRLLEKNHHIKVQECSNLLQLLQKADKDKEMYQLKIQQDLRQANELFLQSKVAEYESKGQSYERKISGLEQQIKAMSMQLQDESILKRKLAIEMNQEKGKMQLTLNQAIESLKNSQADVVDRTLLANLIVSYFKRQKSKDVLELISRILNFNDDQKIAVGLLSPPRNVIQSLFQTIVGAPHAPVEVDGDNLAELWVNFLLVETDNSNGNVKPGNSSSNSSSAAGHVELGNKSTDSVK